MTDLIELQGSYSRAQLKELLKAVEVCKTVLMGMGGDGRAMDFSIEERISRLNFWEQTLETKLQ